MTLAAKSTLLKPSMTYELYLKGSSDETTKLQSADCKVLEIRGPYINVISHLFQVKYSTVSVDKKTNTLTYFKGALKNQVNLDNIAEVKEFVGNFFHTKDDPNYFWKEVSSSPKK